MKIITLIENKSGDRKDLHIEHGLSIYIEIDGKRILFDTGQRGNFIENAKKLNINLKDLDYVIISHGHYDHSGGFERLIKEIKPDIKLYVGKGFFNKKYSLKEDNNYLYRGNSFTEEFLEEKNIPFKYINEDIVSITKNLLVFTNFERDKRFENTNQSMYIKEKDSYKKDMFSDEISIGLKTKDGLIAIVGCSHVGIINMLMTIKKRTSMDIYGLLGGTHIEKEKLEKIDEIAEYFKRSNIKVVGVCHCTGKRGEKLLKERLGEAFMDCATGSDFLSMPD